MYDAILLMFLGIGCGFLLRHKRVIFRWAAQINSYIIYLLLLVMGLSVGKEEQLLQNLSTLGLRAILMGTVATLGSILATWLIYTRWFKIK